MKFKSLKFHSVAFEIFFLLGCCAKIIGRLVSDISIQSSGITSRVGINRKSPFLDMKLHTSEEPTPLAIISLTGILVNVVSW